MNPPLSGINLARACGATTLFLTLAACGGGGGADVVATAPPPPPIVTPSVTVTGEASQVLVGGKPVTLNAAPVVGTTIAWTIVEGPGTLSAASGATVNYLPPAAGISANTTVRIKASAGDATKTFRVTVYPDPGAPGLGLLAGVLGSQGNLDGAGTAARFSTINAIAPDASGNLLVVDGGQRLRKVGAAGAVTTIALPASWPIFTDVSVAPDNTAYLLGLDGESKTRVLKLLPDNSAVPFLTSEQTGQPKRIVAGRAGLFLIGNAQIATVGLDGSAGVAIGNEQDGAAPCRDGNGATARLGAINDAALDAAGNLIVLACSSVRKITPAGVVTTLAGDLTATGTPRDGVGASAHFGNYQASVAIDQGGTIRVLDFDQPVANGDTSTIAYRLRMVAADGTVTTLASGTYRHDTPATPVAGWAYPVKWLRYLTDGTAIVSKGAELRKIADDGTLAAFAGDSGDITGEVTGPVATARFVNPRSISADLAGNLYVLDEVTRQRTTAYKISTAGQVTKILDTTLAPPLAASEIIASPDGTVYISQRRYVGKFDQPAYNAGAIYRLGADGVPQPFAGSTADALASAPRKDGQGAAADFYAITMLGFDADGTLYVEDQGNGALVYRRIDAAGLVTTVAALPAGVGVAPDGYRYRADSGAGLVYRLEASGARTVVAGTAGLSGNRIGAAPGSLIASPTHWDAPLGLAVTPTGPRTLAIVSGGAILKLVLPN
ncbi:hypothetical protein NHH82_06165 [Oxalobacteraceae bacterium OTU3REALA1]|nr:hypothetical protein NHH82_06165 [Oxalobacteraceae bacterium OTU3REALA1]